MFRLYAHAAIVLSLISSAWSQPLTTKIFWVEGSKVRSVNLDGNDLADVVTGLNMPSGLAIDNQSAPKKMYLAERGESRIIRMNLDGSSREEVVTGISGIRDIELDQAHGKIYWIRDTYSNDAVQRADMGGLNSNIEDLYTSTSTGYDFLGIAFDHVNKTVYWTQRNNGCLDKIRRIDADGSNFTTLIEHPRNRLIGPWDIDVVGNRIYWTDCGLSEDIVYSAHLDGSGIDTVVKEVDCQYFIIDPALSKIYWAEESGIGSANLDGTGKTAIVPAGGSMRSGIALAFDVPTHVALPQQNAGAERMVLDGRSASSSHERAGINIYDMAGRKAATPTSAARFRSGATRHGALTNATGTYLFAGPGGAGKLLHTAVGSQNN